MQKTVIIGTFDSQIYEHLSARLGEHYIIRQAQRGNTVLLELLDNPVDLLILDVDLGGMMGTDILPVIRRLRPRLPVILITDDMNTRIRKMAAETGVTYQAFKPMTNSETEAIAIATKRLVERQVAEYAEH